MTKIQIKSNLFALILIGLLMLVTWGIASARISNPADPNSFVSLGVGSTTPALTMGVQGNALISGDLSLANLTATGTITGGNFVASDETATSTFAGGFTIQTNFLVVEDESGNVGIGTANPNVNGFGADDRILTIESTTLDAQGAVELVTADLSAANAAGQIRWINKDGGAIGVSNAAITGFRDGADDAMGLNFFTEATGAGLSSKLIILGNGNVGIGTTTPTYLLTIDSGSSATSSASWGDIAVIGTVDSPGCIQVAGSDGNWYRKYYTDTATEISELGRCDE